MNKFLLFVIAFLITTSLKGQSEEIALSYFESLDSFLNEKDKSIELASYRIGEKYKELDVKVVSFTNLDSQLIEAYSIELGKIKSNQTDSGNYMFKCYEHYTTIQLRARYIYINGNNIPRNQVDSIRTFLLEKYNSGSNFNWLARQYSMDGSSAKGGDTEWFEKEGMMEQFSDAILNHEVGDVFEVNIESNKWYYLVQKTHDNRTVDIFTIVIIKYGG